MKFLLYISIFFLLFLSLNSCRNKQNKEKATERIYNESNNSKYIAANISYLNKHIPDIVINSWISEKPDTKGKFILYDFWSTWCHNCIEGFPYLNKMQKELKENLVIIGIALQKEEEARKLRQPMEFYSAVDKDSKNIEIFKLEGIPHSILVTPEGIVIWEGIPHLKGYELTIEKMKKLIEKYKQ